MRLVQISDKAQIGKNVEIGPFTVIHDNVVIGDGSKIGSHCVIGLPTDGSQGRLLVIGANATIRSHSVLYQGSRLGPKLETGHSVYIRENTMAGFNLRVGTLSDIQGDCALGECVRLHSRVHIASGSKIGDFVWMFPRVQFTNDPYPPSNIEAPNVVEDMAVLATGALLLPGIRIGTGAFVAAGSVVGTNVAATECVRGNPAARFAWLDQFINFEHCLRFPWSNHYRCVPNESLYKLDEVGARVKALMREARAARKAIRV